MAANVKTMIAGQLDTAQGRFAVIWRGWHQDAIYFDHDAPCQDSERHRHCKGRWRGSVSLGYGPDGKRVRPRVSGKTKTIVQDLCRSNTRLSG